MRACKKKKRKKEKEKKKRKKDLDVYLIVSHVVVHRDDVG